MKEGSAHRCYKCGQVFKLINLKETDSIKYEKYTGIMNPYELEELGSDAGWIETGGKI